MSSTVFYEGAAESATLQNTFTVSGVPTDPSTITLIVTDPAGTITTYTYAGSTITRISAGVYQVIVPCNTTDGLWNYAWSGTGPGADLAVGNWRVFPATTNRWYTSLEEVKSRLGITDTQDDFEVQMAIQAAARWVEGRCGRHFYQLADTRTYVPMSMWECHIDDVVSVTSLNVDQNGLGSYADVWVQNTHYELSLGPWAYNQQASGEPRPYRTVLVIGGGLKYFPFIWPLYRMDRIQVIGTFGWPAVPAAITQATLLLAADLFKLKDAPFGVQGFADFGVINVHAGSQVEFLIQPYIDPTRKVGV